MTEPGSGSDAFSLATTAQRKGDHYLLNGSKTFVTNGPIADVLVVYATVDRSSGPRGITTFLVEKGFSGFSAGRQMDKMGLRTSPLGQVSLVDCEVPLENCLGAEGAGVGIFTHSMEWERSCILASAVGEMQRQLEACIRYARERKQFGQPIGKFQLVATKIVDMKVRLETARSLIYRVGWLKSKGRLALMEAAMAKLYISECWVQSCLDAIQIHGGYGYMTDLGLERELRDALGSRLYSGTSEIQRLVIAQLLGL
jgi:alkylation response protein AidB-like acyl-CoA dehydrogenase